MRIYGEARGCRARQKNSRARGRRVSRELLSVETFLDMLDEEDGGCMCAGELVEGTSHRRYCVRHKRMEWTPLAIPVLMCASCGAEFLSHESAVQLGKTTCGPAYSSLTGGSVALKISFGEAVRGILDRPTLVRA